MLNLTSSYIDKILTAYRLGFRSIFRVLVYKILVRFRLHNVVRIDSDDILIGESICVGIPDDYTFDHFSFFNKPVAQLLRSSHQSLSENLFLTNWFNGFVHSNEKRWFEIVDFDADAGDIKGVWELSRWYWSIEIACDSSLPLNTRRNLFEHFSKLWVYQNPYLNGPNWKCGQEVALRLMHFLVGMRLLGYSKDDLSSFHDKFVDNHLRRIKPTLSYAKGQKNNHWISEAVGLIVGGLWLSNNQDAEYYYQLGLSELIEAVDVLFNHDGTFSQSSFNYLRHALTLIAIAKLEISYNGLDDSILESRKLSNAQYLFDQFCEPSCSTTHNWGANDGSNPLAISKSQFLDPSAHKCFYDFSYKGIISNTGNNIVDSLINTYSLCTKSSKKTDFVETSFVVRNFQHSGFTEFPEGGLIFFRNENYRVLIRLPNFNFKPSQDDVGHIDVINKKEGILLDGGTFSYFVDDNTFNYFQGVRSHNTIYRASDKFSMRKFSRFVFGSWTRGSWSIVGQDKLVVKFTNARSDYFQRTLDFKKDRISVSDKAISSVEDDFVSGLTLNSDSLNILNEKFGDRITFGAEKEESSILSIFSNCKASVYDVPVSFCYGDKITRKRIEFSMENQEVKFEIRF